ncbi:MAG: rRNA maturation RNase YbeY [Planctomycetes bacterium]|nr:rRNA maturation RNase YbeY [Planctomycetota bacterium]
MTPARRPKVARKPRLQLEVVDRGKPRTDRALLREVVRATLDHVDRLDLPVSLLLTDDAEIAQIHADYLDDPTPTDVISFALEEGAELVVSVQTARRVAREQGHTIRAEVALYVVHGLLHCCGYDDIRARDRKRMREAERAVMTKLQLRVRAVDDES